jgi:hypothetical protein
MIGLSRVHETRIFRAMQQSHSGKRPERMRSDTLKVSASTISFPVQSRASRAVLAMDRTWRNKYCSYRGLGVLLTRSGGELQRKVATNGIVEKQIKIQSGSRQTLCRKSHENMS